MSRYDGSDRYTYPDSDVLINKADIRDQAALDAFEADATAVRLLELMEYPIPGDFDLSHLKAMHFNLFQDVFDWGATAHRRYQQGRQSLWQLGDD